LGPNRKRGRRSQKNTGCHHQPQLAISQVWHGRKYKTAEASKQAAPFLPSACSVEWRLYQSPALKKYGPPVTKNFHSPLDFSEHHDVG
jgi:4-aminobutyrate aminotransferase-like enzyme